MSQRTLALPLLFSLLAGCAVGPDYVRPAPTLPDRFIGEAALDRRSATANAELVAWWTGFGDAQLARYVEHALKQNLDLAQASARMAQARAGLGAANAALLPSGNLGGQAARAYQSVETPLGQVLNSQPGFDRYGNAYEANLGASWELDIFGGLRRGREAALADYQASEAGAAATRLAVAAQTADIYIALRGLQTRLDIARRQVGTQQDLLSKIGLLYGKGLATELQLHQAEGTLAQVRASVPALEAGEAAAMNALDVMLGAAPGAHRAELATAVAIPAAPRISAAGSPAELLRRRPDLIAAERRLAASNARIGVAVAEYYPKLSLGGTIGSATSVASGNLFTGARTRPRRCSACAGGCSTSGASMRRSNWPRGRTRSCSRPTGLPRYARLKTWRTRSPPWSSVKNKPPCSRRERPLSAVHEGHRLRLISEVSSA